MKYFIETATGSVFAYEDDFDDEKIPGGLEPITQEEADTITSNAANVSWAQECKERIQSLLDNTAKSMGYDDIKSAVTYADEPSVQKFQEDGQSLRRWRSLVWEAFGKVAILVDAGKTPAPDINSFVEGLPKIKG